MNKLLNTIMIWESLSQNKKKKILERPILSQQKNLKKNVSKILKDVLENGDFALKKYTKKFDNVQLKNFYVSKDKLENFTQKIDSKLKQSILLSKKNLEIFHQAQKQKDIDVITYPGVRCQRITLPIQSVGLYVPGNKFPLISTALMLSVPAILSGCSDITICTPPPVSAEILYIAKICKIKKILQLGGAQGIAALAFGTTSIQKVNKIFGPGNMYVTEAKLQVSQKISGVSIDMLAGPTEVLIIADEFSNVSYIASDLLAQSEHDKNSQFFLLTPSLKIAELIQLEIIQQFEKLENKKNIKKVFTHSYIILTKNLFECFKISNQYSPEHLILHIKNSRDWIPEIKNAGSVFLGSWTPEAAGDYMTGANHVLPTYGSSKTYSSLGLSDFQKHIIIQEIQKNSLNELSSYITTLSNLEGMEAHTHSVNIRTLLA
ncbi:histidinol dehydrogenase [Buchnera aphidicola]|uniref:histidinol dehydrogenase n=1 Tax=Buchnera aphidicola TaxID=9 RepID=UPI0031B82B68